MALTQAAARRSRRTLLPTAPFHDVVHAHLMVAVTATVVAMREARFADNDLSTEGRAARRRGARAMDFFDPDAGMHASNKGGVMTPEDFAASMPYIHPALWHESAKAVGVSHSGVRLLWALSMVTSQKLHVASAPRGALGGVRGGGAGQHTGRSLFVPSAVANKTLADTLREIPELVVEVGLG